MAERIIIVDWNIYQFSAIFAWNSAIQQNRGYITTIESQYEVADMGQKATLKGSLDEAKKNLYNAVPPTWTCMNMIIGALKAVGVQPDDKIIIARDSIKGSWRKDYEKDYKANRKDFRESFKDIDWTATYSKFNDLLNQVQIGTDMEVIELHRLEADDIAAVIAQKTKDLNIELILISWDSDWEALTFYPHVKLYSSKAKRFKPPIKDIHSFTAKKIQKETTDNLVSPVITAEDYENRRICVDLINLPGFVVDTIAKAFFDLKPKTLSEDAIENIKSPSIRARLLAMYNNEPVNYEKSINYKSKKQRAKEKVKKEKKIKKEKVSANAV
jgi:hypothetical protein